MPPKINGISAAAIEQLITQRVAGALLASEANQNSGNGNKNNNGSHDSGSGGRRATEGAVGGALTWWNSHVRTVGHDAAYGMPWKNLMKMITEAYCPRSEIKKLDTELWNLTMKEAIKLARSLMDQKVRAYAARIIGDQIVYGSWLSSLTRSWIMVVRGDQTSQTDPQHLWKRVGVGSHRVINDKLGAKGSSNARNNGSRSFLIVHEASRQLGEDDEFPAERLHLEPGG
ncbi:hypothetical protein Tco_1485409 [Tanacetum coccineum]